MCFAIGRQSNETEFNVVVRSKDVLNRSWPLLAEELHRRAAVVNRRLSGPFSPEVLDQHEVGILAHELLGYTIALPSGDTDKPHCAPIVIPSSVPRRLSRPVFRSKAWTRTEWGLGSHGT